MSGILDFLGSALKQSLDGLIINPLKLAPNNFSANINSVVQRGIQDAKGNPFPTSDASINSKLKQYLGDGAGGATYLVSEDIVIQNKIGDKTTEEDGSIVPAYIKLEKGSFISRVSGGLESRITYNENNFQFGLLGSPSLFFRDINRDGPGGQVGRYFWDNGFTDEFGGVWAIITPSNTSYDRLRNTGFLDQANIHRLPNVYSNPVSTAYPFAIGSGKWLIQNKPMYDLNSLNPQGHSPALGFLGFGGQPSYFDISNPYAIGNGLLNHANAVANATPVTTTLEVVPADQLATNTDYQTLKNWVQGGATYQNGNLSGFGLWPVQYDGKTVTNAYVNQLGELLVEYA